MELRFVAAALVAGLVARRLGLPPLVGFLLAGFGLAAAGHQSTADLERLASGGVTLLLFSIGLKLKPSSLAQPVVWAGASLCMLVSVALGAAVVLGLGRLGWAPLGEDPTTTALLVGFALSFSSTVLAVKLLDGRGESSALHGRVAIGVLIMQDLVAVVFLAVAAGKLPSPWALGLVALWPLRLVLRRLLAWAGHGELLVLNGVVLCFGAWWGFEQLGLKGDLGALVAGALLAGSVKADELAHALMGLKDLLLVGFFLTIGLSSPVGPEALGLAALLLLLVPIKAGLFFGLFLAFRLRARTSLFAASTLANSSEFGLLVGSVGVSLGLLPASWLAVLAVCVSITFVAGAAVRRLTDRLHLRHHGRMLAWQRSERLPGDEPLDPGGARAIVLGMGRLGRDLYDELETRLGPAVIGVDQDAAKVRDQRAAGRRVLLGDASDVDFWERVVDRHSARLILMTMTSAEAKQRTAKVIGDLSCDLTDAERATVGAVARFEDEAESLKAAGVDMVHDLLREAGRGFAAHVAEASSAVTARDDGRPAPHAQP